MKLKVGLTKVVGPKRNVCAFAAEKQPNASNDNKIFFMCCYD